MADRFDISQRKKDHLALCAGDNVGFRQKTTLLEEVELIHDALPELHADEVDSSVTLLGKTLQAPVIVAAMTGGTDEAAQINRDLAQVADELGLGFGLGSQRAMFERPETAWTFQVRERAPRVLLLGNLGLVQAKQMTTEQIATLCADTGADALCIHLNPAMEIVQPGGDRDFAGGVALLQRLAAELPIPVVAKETGCGLSRSVGQRVRGAGIGTVDVSGSGGTSWVAVEAHRAVDDVARHIAEELWDWGIPTAASILQLRGLSLDIIATGGMRTGSDVAKAVALGAKAAGLAAPVLKAHRAGGIDGARSFLTRVVQTVRALMLLTGSRTIGELQRCPKILGPSLARWSPG
ncbi:MAG: type 2 isopentenyl-diphosphate Delta-isomerase [Myxococcales bacterium]|nr:type 2 isopentenyl-diphosphate Delta-isomerase [Myxococcales bacterium]